MPFLKIIMPQLDGLIIQSQVNFFLFFFIGYFFFLKYILPLISFFFKLKHKLVVSNLNWFSNNFNMLIFYRKNFLFGLFKLVNMFKVVSFFKNKTFIFFNLYLFDYLMVKNAVDKKNK